MIFIVSIRPHPAITIFDGPAEKIIEISRSFNVDAQIIGKVEPFSGKKLTIQSEFGKFEY